MISNETTQWVYRDGLFCPAELNAPAPPRKVIVIFVQVRVRNECREVLREYCEAGRNASSHNGALWISLSKLTMLSFTRQWQEK